MGCGASISIPTNKPGNSSGKSTVQLILLGKTGVGKSALGNAILGGKKFETAGPSIESTTLSCHPASAVIGDKNIIILDTPGLMGTNADEEYIIRKLFEGANSLQPDPIVFLLVIRADVKFTKEETEVVEIFSKVFGEEMYKHLIFVFTHKSALDKSNITKENCLMKLPVTFQQFKECCIEIETEGNAKQVKQEVQQLLEVVENLLQKNGEDCYSCEKIKEIEKRYLTRIEDKRGLRAKCKELYKQAADAMFDTVADATDGFIGQLTGTISSFMGKISNVFGSK